MDTQLEVLVGDKLREHGLRLAIAESCTGGLIGHRITNLAGSSTYYMGSITAYAYEAKVRLLEVSWATLENHGAVSDEAVRQMALGVRRAMAADIGISVSGIAGPGGGTVDKPVGLVYFGLSTSNGDESTHKNFKGDREAVKLQAADFTLQYLIDYLAGQFGQGD